ncbi:immunity-related GTPase family M protein-like [Acomys russatus]|uniref:immunity-related GTPase family M protein-like n=1 Tax=Acomys russatus TaxID=60746 RepID=UPI0021E30976|nr:immunity-related GTPase family M protein-like [Acomys russatus]
MVVPTCRVAPLLTSMEEADGFPEDRQLTCFSNAVFIHEDSNILTVEVIKNLEAAVARGDGVEVVSRVKEIIQKASRTPVKIAVTGDSGNGMSSFINALRNIGHEEEDSAPTGVVRTTEKPACYSSNFPSVELWDLPGTGTTAQSMEDYIDEMQFDTYDLVVIIASEQFSSNHVKLAKAMQSMRKRFYVVWTKLDRDLSTSALAEPQLLQSIQRNIQENLQKEEVREPPTFLVSNFTPFSHDFPKLREMLQKDLSDGRREGLLEILFKICEDTIKERVGSIERSIDTGTLDKDFRILNPDNLVEIQKAFQKAFGVDDESLHQVALSMGKNDIKFQGEQDGWASSWLYQTGSQLFLTSLDHVQCCFTSHSYRCKQQKRVLDEVAESTKGILRNILKESINLPLEDLDS